MIARLFRAALVVLPVGAILVCTSMLVSGQSGVKNGDWLHWGGDLGNTKYSPLDQITAENVKTLRIAWRWKADNFGPRADANYETTPLAVNGVLYTIAGTRRDVVAIDGATGETLWMYRLDEGTRFYTRASDRQTGEQPDCSKLGWQLIAVH